MTARAAPVPTDGNLKDQWKLALKAARHRPKLSGLQLAVLIEVIDRFVRAKGNGRASSRYVAKALGVDRRNVRDAMNTLQALGYLVETRKGHGTRPIKYRPRFELASGGTGTPTTDIDASGGTGTPTVGVLAPPLQTPSGGTGTPESFLRSRLTTGVREEGISDGAIAGFGVWSGRRRILGDG